MNWNPVAETRNDDYFRIPHIIPLFLVPFGMGLLSMTFLAPELLPVTLLGPIGSLAVIMTKYLPTVTKIIFYAAWAVHIIEAWISVKICRQKGITPAKTRLWCIQTFIYGWFSFMYLTSYEPKKKEL